MMTKAVKESEHYKMKKVIYDYGMIVFGSLLYGIATIAFIFPHSLLLGGTTGISVILNRYIPFSPGDISIVINLILLIIAFVVLGKEMAIKTIVGSVLTSVFIGIFERLLDNNVIVSNIYISAFIGASIIAVASGVMFYVKSSSGGTDIIALVVQKYSEINIGRALLITDFLIVVVGGFLAGYVLLASSFLGLLVKTFGIDFVIGMIKRKLKVG